MSVRQSLAAADRDGWLDLLLVELVEPHLGQERPMILYDYPASQAALARVRTAIRRWPSGSSCSSRHRTGQRLSRAARRRRAAAAQRSANRQRAADGKPPLPEESRLLAAMEHGLPACTGVALGFDRLVMLAAGAENDRRGDGVSDRSGVNSRC